MRRMNRAWVVAVLALAGAGLCACLTASEVRGIVSESNATLLPGADLGVPAESGSATWKESVEKIDAFIKTHPDQAALVASLRVRQALILIVNRQQNHAELVLSLVKPADLHVQRDKVFFAVGNDLAWWYKRAGKADAFEVAERQTARSARQGIHAQSGKDGLDPGLRSFLETTSALIAVKLTNGATGDAERSLVTKEVEDAARRTLGLLDAPDRTWVKDNATGTDLPVAVDILRRRIWARLVFRELRKAAKDERLTPAWPEPWLGTTAFE